MKITIGVLVAVVLGLALGRTTAPSSPPASALIEAASPSPGPTRKTVGVGVGFSRTRQGAILAAGSYQQAFADKAILRRAELRRRIEVVATPTFRRTMLEANEPGALRLARGGFGQALRAGVPSAFFGVPVGYRLLSFSPSRAVVETWGFSLIGNVSAIEPTAYFGLSRTELAWVEGDWKIAATRASFGPTPRLGSPRPGAEGVSLVELIGELRPYGLAP
jgi:hypothetical protein